MHEVDCVVVGAGVIGLAVARARARQGFEVILIEREPEAGQHTSSRNSAVIHAGLHYEPDSLKARLCVRGRDLLYAFCAQNGIAHRRCGKWTVAVSQADVGKLQSLARNAMACGVDDLSWIEGAEARRLEPLLACSMALSSPATGIIDSHAYLQCLLGDAQAHGAQVVYRTQVRQLESSARGVLVFTEQSGAPSLSARHVVNCAGLHAHQLAAATVDFPKTQIPKIHYAKGSYFSVSGRSPFDRLIYPAPSGGGHLGIHMTLDLAGQARFGPDLEWCEGIDYGVQVNRAPAFAAAIREYWPAVPAQRLQPAFAGVRPKLSGPGESARDFLLQGPAEHGLAGIFNLFGIDSPGLTASLALAEQVAQMLDAG